MQQNELKSQNVGWTRFNGFFRKKCIIWKVKEFFRHNYKQTNYTCEVKPKSTGKMDNWGFNGQDYLDAISPTTQNTAPSPNEILDTTLTHSLPTAVRV